MARCSGVDNVLLAAVLELGVKFEHWGRRILGRPMDAPPKKPALPRHSPGTGKRRKAVRKP